MNLETYKYSSGDNLLDFEFNSEGPRGKVIKAVRYMPMKVDGIVYFNLRFGDLNQKTGKVDDLAVTNNLDREKIRAIIAATVLECTRHFPDIMKYAQGSTRVRTRLYQIGISANWDKIDALLDVYGYEQDRGWQPFRKNVNYLAFLAKRKEVLNVQGLKWEL